MDVADRKPIIALDYDGTIVQNAWPDHGKPLPGAAKSIKQLLNDFDIVIHTCRIAPYDMEGGKRTGSEVAKEVTAVHAKLRMMGLPWLPIHQDPWKPNADIYLDDKGMHFTGWQDVNRQIEKWKIVKLITEAQRAK